MSLLRHIVTGTLMCIVRKDTELWEWWSQEDTIMYDRWCTQAHFNMGPNTIQAVTSTSIISTIGQL